MFKTESIPVHLDYLKYPSSDGQHIAETTLHFEWMVKLKENLDECTQGQNIFVASDLLWYPVRGDTKICKAPDVMVAIGRPKGDRYSYLQWHEADIPPQVVIEIFSKSNRSSKNKQGTLEFYLQYGVEEFYSYDPEKNLFTVRLNKGDYWQTFEDVTDWTSSFLGIRFKWSEAGRFQIYTPSGTPFKSFLEIKSEITDISEKYKEEKRQRIKEREAHLKAEHDNRLRMIAAEMKVEAISREKAILMEKLKSMGIDPASLI